VSRPFANRIVARPPVDVYVFVEAAGTVEGGVVVLP
jgi:hypothetical protein